MFCSKCSEGLKDRGVQPINTDLGIRMGDVIEGGYVDIDKYDPETGGLRVERVFECPCYQKTNSWFFGKGDNGHGRIVKMETIKK